MGRQTISVLAALALFLLLISAGMAQTAVGMASVHEGALRAAQADEPTRRFVELYLRLAGAETEVKYQQEVGYRHCEFEIVERPCILDHGYERCEWECHP